ncbi:hypothetical protein P8936_03805 [Edaphobacter paludis]|uniref:Transporter n=1 Tax=Edaphobacter paludis TaxID=3035702 RepID=A0AAU7D976_9BACT
MRQGQCSALWVKTFVVIVVCLALQTAHAQDNYEIQVYGAETVPAKNTMVELHSNFTVDGSKAVPGSRYAADGTFPTNHAEHETVEITQGVTNWSEVGFYIFTSASGATGYQWVGDHIRPRVRVPDSWKWPVGASLSMEVGYQRARFSPDTWTLEIRPIVDKQIGRWYFAFNPAMDRSFQGPGTSQGLTFSPNVKVSYDFTKKITGGLEYYAAYGDLAGFDSLHDQQQQIFPAIDLNLSPKWEVNFGVGIGPTASTDHWIVKGIIGRRFTFGHRDREAGKTTETKPKQ